MILSDRGAWLFFLGIILIVIYLSPSVLSSVPLRIPGFWQCLALGTTRHAGLSPFCVHVVTKGGRQL
jgi:hypothetical protein